MTDDSPAPDMLAHSDSRMHRLVGGSQPVGMLDGHDRRSRHHSGKRHHATARGNDFLARVSAQIHTSVPRLPILLGNVAATKYETFYLTPGNAGEGHLVRSDRRTGGILRRPDFRRGTCRGGRGSGCAHRRNRVGHNH